MGKMTINYPHERSHEHSIILDCEHCLNSFGCQDNNIPDDSSESDWHYCKFLIDYSDRLEYYRELNDQMINIEDDLPF